MATATEAGAMTQRALATRNLLYEAAAELFVERGYENTTMSDIAERAGTSRRTAFNHFPSKGDIPMLWTRLRADRAVEKIAESASADALERIRSYFRLLGDMITAEPELSRQMLLGWTAATGPIRYESQLLTDLTPLLEQGREQGCIAPTVDVAEAARTLSDVYLGAVFRWVRDQEASETLQAVAGGGIELVLSAIRSRS
ncbi:TetR/AcrR family transcriptional regulator [Pseudonocardia yuanmonensis]|uniref:TetR/AcrR family transcriptional regulator n=1 Tax=Pseudonocardia yuanmonensis TaxID=1095914 RepID=A0ABP8WLJ0_9PSEU